jgi:hypothetical protein
MKIDTNKFDEKPKYKLGTCYIDSCGRPWLYVKKVSSNKCKTE